MSSFDKTAGKNLDEILASIRKTLADESGQPQAHPPPPTAATDPTTPASAQNGTKAAIANVDDDVADLLAGGLGGSAPLTEPKETPLAAGVPKDPLWFLRPSAGREQVSPRADAPVSPAGDALAAPAVSPERPSLAALFVADKGSGRDDVQATVNGLAAAPVQTEAKSLPEVGSVDSKASDPAPSAHIAPPGTALPGTAGPLPPQVAAGDVTVTKPPADARAPSKPDLARSGVAAAAAAPDSPGTEAGAVPAKPAAAPTAARSPRPADPERSQPAAVIPGRAQGSGASPIVHTSAAAARANALNGAASATTQAPSAASPTAAVSAAAASAGPTQALEQIIEQLLEPLLRRWVEANLPRLVDAAIRAEVARALEARRASGQDIDRKV
jgi:cell pole-organizing protein PopZ